MKFRAHETFFIRKGWLYKGLKNIENDPRIFVSKERNPMDVLGIGANMVKSLRYWLQATGLTTEQSVKTRAKEQHATDLATIILENDTYFEEIGTLWLIHYKLMSNKELAPAWYYFFNEFSLKEFQREDFNIGLEKFASMYGDSPSLSSIDDDFNCLINTYILRKRLNPTKGVNPESTIECPLDELGLVDLSSLSRGKDRTFIKTIPKLETIPSLIFFSVISEQSQGRKEIKFSELLNSPCNVGKVFNLDLVALSRLLDVLAKKDLIDVVRTAGLDVIKIKSEMSFNECVSAYYSSLNG